MHVNLEYSARKYKSARASNFGNCLRIIHSTISIKNLINFHIKPAVDPLQTSNVVYRFECECDSVYIGETQQCLRNRIWQHRYRDSHIGKHIHKCIPYKAALHETYSKPGGPNVPDQRTFLESHFSILNREVQTSLINELF